MQEFDEMMNAYNDFVKSADEFINKQKQNRHIQKLQAKLDHLRAKKEGLNGKKRRWCNYQISRKVILLKKLNQLQEWGVECVLYQERESNKCDTIK